VDCSFIWHNFGIQHTFCQPVTTTIPTSESLGLKSTANISSNDPPLPHAASTESKLQREEWMMLEPTRPVLPAGTPPLQSLRSDSPTEGYGEKSSNNRTASGQVDFFSSLGTEHRKKETKDKHNPEAVRRHLKSRLNSLKR
jgi:hypothetical protein